MDFPVASAFFALLIGKKGTTKKRIEGETKTRISIPKQVFRDAEKRKNNTYVRTQPIVVSIGARLRWRH